MKNGKYCRPYTSRIDIVYPIVAALNRSKVHPIWLCPDPRNVLKCDNLARLPDRPIFAQYNERRGQNIYEYAGIELLAIDHLSEMTLECDRAPFGAMINEGSRDARALARKRLVRPWVIDQGGELVGVWRPETVTELGIAQPRTVPVTEVQRTVAQWKATVALPAHGHGWVTAKVWEAFAAGTVCFAHPRYDDQNHAYGRLDRDVARFLRPADPVVLTRRIQAVDRSEALRREVVEAQSAALRAARAAWNGGERAIIERIEDRARGA